jgi:hypothetical protein
VHTGMVDERPARDFPAPGHLLDMARSGHYARG